MSNPTVVTINIDTGEQTVREYSDEEVAEFEQMPPTVENTLTATPLGGN